MSTPLGVIEQFLHPPIGLVRREHIGVTAPGADQTLTRVRGTRFVDAYGLELIVQDSPPGYGSTSDSTGVTYDRRMWSAAVFHLLLDNQIVQTQLFETQRGDAYFLFNESFPYSVHVHPAPGVSLDMFWLLRLFP
jgi:hypothetical protein